MRIFENAHFQFIQHRNVAYMISGGLILLGMLSLLFRGIEVGIDFKGGTELVVATDTELPVTGLRETLAEAFDLEPEVKRFDRDVLIRLTEVGDADSLATRVTETIAAHYPGSNPAVVKQDVIAPRFAQDLVRGAIYAVLGSLLVILLYISIRFEWRFGAGAVAALFHDVLITLGLFALLHHFLPFSLQIDQTIIAAFLTIVGYSINDTVVVFDRIREEMGIRKGEDFETVVNDAINSTLSRTLITSGTTLLVVFVLFILGGDVLKGFAFALLVGIGVGTYSSIFVASPVVVELRKRMKPAVKPAVAKR